MKKEKILVIAFLVVLLVVSAFLFRGRFLNWTFFMPHHYQYYGGWHMGNGSWFYGFVALLLFGGGLSLFVWLIVYLTKDERPRSKQTLDMRLARGDISLEEYREIKDTLGKGR